MYVNNSNDSMRTEENMLTNSVVQATLSTIQATSKTLTTSGGQKKDDTWVLYIAIIGIATVSVVVCTLVAIIASRIRSIRKAKAEYARQRQQATEEIKKQKRDSELRTYSRSRTSTQSTEAFYIEDFEHIDGYNDAVFGDIVHYDEFIDGQPRKSSFIQAIPAFSKATSSCSGDNREGTIETPPPRLSPSFQSSAERYGTGLLPPRRHSIVTLYPYTSVQISATRKDDYSPPPILPREPINQTTLPNARVHKKRDKQGGVNSKEHRRKRAHSLFDKIDNQGYISEEVNTPIEPANADKLPEPDELCTQ